MNDNANNTNNNSNFHFHSAGPSIRFRFNRGTNSDGGTASDMSTTVRSHDNNNSNTNNNSANNIQSSNNSSAGNEHRQNALNQSIPQPTSNISISINATNNTTNDTTNNTTNDMSSSNIAGRNQLRRIMIQIPHPRPLPQINVSMSDLTEQPHMPQLNLPEQQQHQQGEGDRQGQGLGQQDSSAASATNPKIVSSFPSEFECKICCEVMTKPTSCGSCEARYCRACIMKEIISGASASAATATPNASMTKKCPFCRKVFPIMPVPSNSNSNSNINPTSNLDLSNVLFTDQQLEYKIQHWNHEIKHCIYKEYGCNVLCKALNVTLHEQTCLYKPYKCKYACLGCKFINSKQKLNEHYGNVKIPSTVTAAANVTNRHNTNYNPSATMIEKCPFANLDPIIKEQRIQKIQHQHLHSTLQSRLMQERTIIIGTTNQMMTLQCKSLYNVIDFMSCLYCCTCQTVNFIFRSTLWQSFWNCSNTRSVVHNYVMLIPSMVWGLKTGLFGLELLWEWIGKWDERRYDIGTGAGAKDENENEEAEDTVILFIIIWSCGWTVLMGALFLLFLVCLKHLFLSVNSHVCVYVDIYTCLCACFFFSLLLMYP
jgi:hypothetical protein